MVFEMVAAGEGLRKISLFLHHSDLLQTTVKSCLFAIVYPCLFFTMRNKQELTSFFIGRFTGPVTVPLKSQGTG